MLVAKIVLTAQTPSPTLRRCTTPDCPYPPLQLEVEANLR